MSLYVFEGGRSAEGERCPLLELCRVLGGDGDLLSSHRYAESSWSGLPKPPITAHRTWHRRCRLTPLRSSSSRPPPQAPSP